MSTSITDGQKKQYFRFIEDAAERALKVAIPDKDGLQKLFENGDELQARIVTAIREFSVGNQFADEETDSKYGYLSGYKPKGITEQTNILRQLFRGVGFADEKIAEQVSLLRDHGRNADGNGNLEPPVGKRDVRDGRFRAGNLLLGQCHTRRVDFDAPHAHIRAHFCEAGCEFACRGRAGTVTQIHHVSLGHAPQAGPGGKPAIGATKSIRVRRSACDGTLRHDTSQPHRPPGSKLES